jgi:hypothetical protein
MLFYPPERGFVSWQERFRRIRELAREQEAGERERKKLERKRLHDMRGERRKVVRELAPRVQGVCREFSRGVQGRMSKYRTEDWRYNNFGWNLQMKFGGIRVRGWPWLRDPDRPLMPRGIWLQYLDPEGVAVVDVRRTRGTKLNGGENPTAPGYYYWHLHEDDSRCAFGYFLALDGFTEEKLAKNLERIGLDLLRFGSEDFSRPSVRV